MDNIGNDNLFTSHFTVGCRETSRDFTKTDTEEIKALHRWMNFKDNDWGMERYKTSRTQYICYFHIIPIHTLNDIINDLYCIYIKHYPYSVKADFINRVFDATINELKQFIEWNDRNEFTWLSNPRKETIYSYYTIYGKDNEYYDYGILDTYDIDYYAQYYKRVLDIIDKYNPIQTEKPKRNNLLTETQKEIIDKLLLKGFSDVHIYRFLRDERNFITITQREFNIYMNEKYLRNYNPNKRITALKDISIPVELGMYFIEIMP